MYITFLGTSAGKPSKERNLSAIALQYEQENQWYLIDCGEATQHMIMRSNLRLGKLAKIFITHLHGDHCYGLAGLLASRSIDEINTPIEIYGPKGIKELIEVLKKITKHSITDNVSIIEIDDEGADFSFERFELKAVALEHSVTSFAYCFYEYPSSSKIDERKLKQIGIQPGKIYAQLKEGKTVTLEDGRIIDGKEYLLKPDRGTKVIIAGDNCNPGILGNELQDLDLLIHESTYTQDVYDGLKKKVLHTTSKKLAKVSKKYNVKNLIATHISPRYLKEPKNSQKNISLMEDEIARYYGDYFYIANDLDIFKLDRSDYKLKKLNS